MQFFFPLAGQPLNSDFEEKKPNVEAICFVKGKVKTFHMTGSNYRSKIDL